MVKAAEAAASSWNWVGAEAVDPAVTDGDAVSGAVGVTTAPVCASTKVPRAGVTLTLYVPVGKSPNRTQPPVSVVWFAVVVVEPPLGPEIATFIPDCGLPLPLITETASIPFVESIEPTVGVRMLLAVTGGWLPMFDQDTVDTVRR